MDPCRSEFTEVKEDQIDESYAVRQRLRTLLDLTIAIGKRKGLIGNNGNMTSDCSTVNDKGGNYVTNKRRI